MLAGLDTAAYFHIDVCTVLHAQQWIMWDYPSIVQGDTIFHYIFSNISPFIMRIPITFICFWNKLLWKFFVHFPSSIHGELMLAWPQGPCIMDVVMVLCNSGNFSSSGILAYTHSWKSFRVHGFVVLSQIAKMWACGGPHFCHSTT